MDVFAAVAVQGGPWGIIALGVVSFMRGWIVSRKVHEDRVSDLKQRAEDYKAAWEAEKRTSEENRQQVSILLGRTREPTA